MQIWEVVVSDDNDKKGRLIGPNFDVSVILGRGGVTPASEKKEGDGATPLGRYPVRQIYYRADHQIKPISQLPITAISPDMGWCDAPDHSAYNQLVMLPFAASHEKMWRDDHLYDLVLVVGHNDDPVVPGAGSAIFIHQQRPDGRPTEGCVALLEQDLKSFLRLVSPDDFIEITI